ncbi:MAG: hypothetical protein WCO82_01170 [Sphingomonadales bacterium]|jgi:hypothetical protein
MFIGHYAASVAAKAAAPRLPFWACVGAAQLLDIGWAGLVMAGVEKLRLVPGLPGSPLDLYFMPYTHSLAMALLWSLLAGLLAVRAWGRAGWLIGATVFSHWLADALVHRPDLAPWPGSPLRLGLGLWNLPILEMIVEIGLLGLVVVIWVAGRKQQRLQARPATGWFVAMLVLAAVNAVPGEAPSPAGMAALALMAYVVAMAVGWLVDRADRSARG